MKNMGRFFSRSFHSPGRATNFHRYIKNSRTSDYDVASHARNPNHRTIPPIRRILLVIKRNDFTHVVSSIDTRGWIPVHPGWSTSPCFPSQEFPTARNIVHVVAATPTLLKGFTIYSGVDFRPTHGIAWYQPRMFEQKRPTRQLPTPPLELTCLVTGRLDEKKTPHNGWNSRKKESFDSSVWPSGAAHSHPSFSPPVYGNWGIKVSCCSSSNYSIINRKDRYLEKTRKRENYRESKISR